MNIKSRFLAFSIFFICFFSNAAEPAVFVHNSIEEINAFKGKLKLKLVRVWGGENEEDENKFFKTPTSVAVDKNGLVYICDMHSHCIKVFNPTGKYLRTIGRKGRGPSDLFAPVSIAISPDGGLVVYEYGGRRVQWFSPEGKSKKIIKSTYAYGWIEVTSKDELAVYNHNNTLESGKLLSILDPGGKTIREIGIYHDKSKSYLESEKLIFAIDEIDNVYAANLWTPVIRKYSPDGKLLMAITFETPFKVPFEVGLNSAGDEITKIETIENPEKIQANGNKNSRTIQRVLKKGEQRIVVFNGIGTDSQGRIYVVTKKRPLTEKETMGTAIIMSANGLSREMVDFDVVESIDANSLQVFNSNGKIAAEAQLTSFCDNIHINGNRIFIVDGFFNQRILEYEMSFEEEKER